MSALSILLLYTLPFWIPAIVGLYLCAANRNAISFMAGLLTLKPIVTTPIWFAILAKDLRPEVVKLAVSVLPGAGLTVLAILVFWPLFSGPQAGVARTLLALDCLRWLNSAAIVALASAGDFSQATGSLVCMLAQIGLALPTVYAALALTMSLLVTRGGQAQDTA